MRRVGLIADTHGLLRAEAVEALRGSDLIVHAGDVGDPAILEALGRLAPVRAVRGNNDRGAWAAALPETDRVDVGGIALYVLHDIGELAIDPGTSGCRVVVAGHSHRPAHAVREGVHFVNPGSAGPRRFRLPVSVARLSVDGDRVAVELVELSVAPPIARGAATPRGGARVRPPSRRPAR
jgi:putative phosphoesterase